MDLQLAIQRLVATDHLDEWTALISDIAGQERKVAFSAAEPLWIERMILEGKLLIHPAVAADLRAKAWEPSNVHRRMIWASILASIDGPASKDRFNAIKARIIKKHGNNWWLDIYKRVKPTYAARMRLRKSLENTGSALHLLASKSTVLGLAVHEERMAALEMIPRE